MTCQASRSSSTSGADNYRRTSRSRSRVDPASEPAEAAVPAADAGAGDIRRPEPDKKERGSKERSRSRVAESPRIAEPAKPRKPQDKAAAAKPAAKAGTAGAAGVAAVPAKQEADSSYSYYSSSEEPAVAQGETPAGSKAPAVPAECVAASKRDTVDKAPASAAAKKAYLQLAQLNLAQKKELMNSFLSTAFQEVMK